MNQYDTVTLLTDLGMVTEDVGVLHSILRELAPHSAVVDLCHDVARDDTRAGALMLARSVAYLAPGVVLASVGSAGERPPIAVEVGDGQAVLVGPDNGLLAAAVAVVGGASRAVALTSEAHQFASPGAPFDARDVLAPAAGHLASGAHLMDLGDEVDPAMLLPSLVPVPRLEDDGSLSVEALHVDRRGSVQLNIDREALDALGDVVVVTAGDEQRVMRVADTADGAAVGQMILAEDVHGLVAIHAGAGSAASTLAVGVGSELTIREAT